jgi:Electron transfer DM13
MRNLIMLLAATGIFMSCSKDKTGDNGYMAPAAGNGGMASLKGAFYSTAGIEVSGSATVVFEGGDYSVLLDSFSVTAGPDLKVYLSKKETPFEFINLGPLRSNSGSQRYAVPPGTNFAVYKYALIHCQQYNHLFAIAPLKP